MRKTKSGRGSPLYLAPERLTRKYHNPFSADAWSLGVTFYKMLLGETPFEMAQDTQELIAFHETNSSSSLSVNIPESVSPCLAEILKGMLMWCPEKRWSLEKIKEKLVELPKIGKEKSI